MIFCITRKAAEITALFLAEWWIRSREQDRFWGGPAMQHFVATPNLQGNTGAFGKASTANLLQNACSQVLRFIMPAFRIKIAGLSRDASWKAKSASFAALLPFLLASTYLAISLSSKTPSYTRLRKHPVRSYQTLIWCRCSVGQVALSSIAAPLL